MGGKRQNGLTAEKVQELRRKIRRAAESLGETKVANALGTSSVDNALAGITVDMPKREFGAAANAIKQITKPPRRGNKYAQFSKAGTQANAHTHG